MAVEFWRNKSEIDWPLLQICGTLDIVVAKDELHCADIVIP